MNNLTKNIQALVSETFYRRVAVHCAANGLSISEATRQLWERELSGSSVAFTEQSPDPLREQADTEPVALGEVA